MKGQGKGSKLMCHHYELLLRASGYVRASCSPFSAPSACSLHLSCACKAQGSRNEGWARMHRYVELVSTAASTNLQLSLCPRCKQNSQSEVCRINLPCMLHVFPTGYHLARCRMLAREIRSLLQELHWAASLRADRNLGLCPGMPVTHYTGMAYVET